jgi:alpha-tubulin suppressor-like RCC1 family protein
VCNIYNTILCNNYATRPFDSKVVDYKRDWDYTEGDEAIYPPPPPSSRIYLGFVFWRRIIVWIVGIWFLVGYAWGPGAVVALTVGGVDPAVGPTAGGTEIIISGDGFMDFPVIRQIGMGERHVLIVYESGLMYAFGDGSDYRLGTGSTTSVSYENPALVNGNGDILLGTKIVQVSAYFNGSAAIDDEGNLYMWGSAFGSVFGGSAAIPKKVNGISGSEITEQTKIVEVECTQSHGGNWELRGSCLALDGEGNVYAWGDGRDGELGNATNSSIALPTMINSYGDFATAVKIVEVSISDSAVTGAGGLRASSVALDINGNVYTWGNNTYGQLGDGTNTAKNVPTLNPYLSSIKTVSATASTFYAIDNGGDLFVWGRGSYEHWGMGSGKIGNNSTSDANIPVLINNDSNGSAITTDTNIVMVVGGFATSYALDDQGNAYGWGHANFYMFGDGVTSQYLVPVKLNGLSEQSLISANTRVVKLNTHTSISPVGVIFLTVDNKLIYFGSSCDNYMLVLGTCVSSIPYGLYLTNDPHGVLLDTAPCIIESWADTEIVCVTSTHVDGLVDLYVSAGADEVVVEDAYLYRDYTILMGLTPGQVFLEPTAQDIISGSSFGVTQEISVSTNYPDGYALRLELVGMDDRLVSMLPTYIPAVDCDFVAPCPLGMNTYGLSLDGVGFFAPPVRNVPVTLREVRGPVQGDVTELVYGVRIDTSVVPATYATSILVTVVAN